MAVKIYRLPDEVPAPKVDYMNYNREKEMAAEAAHKAALKKFYGDQGYTGPNSGKVYSEGVADGSADYMVFEAPRGSNLREKFFLIHLPYGDAYHSQNVRFLTKTEIIKRLNAAENFRKLFGSK
jgi:hypothetical protein